MKLAEPQTEPVAIAHVDIVGSTKWLVGATQPETERMVDGLFAAAQSAVRDRSVAASQYVGDGVFLSGRDTGQVADAALRCIEALADEPGLPARAGLAYGPIVRRAGDFFGLTVNLSVGLTKVAPVGGILASEAAAALLPEAMVLRPSAVTIAGIDDPVPAALLCGVESGLPNGGGR